MAGVQNLSAVAVFSLGISSNFISPKEKGEKIGGLKGYSHGLIFAYML